MCGDGGSWEGAAGVKFHSSATDQTSWAVSFLLNLPARLFNKVLLDKKKKVSIVAKDRADRIESAIN